MTIYIKDIFEPKFIKEFIPQIIVARVKSLVKSENVKQMNKFLKSNYAIDIDDVINALKFSINKVSNIYSSSVSNVAKERKSQEKVITLVKLIDYGNLHVKGLNIVNSSMNYVNNNIKVIYKHYMMKGGN